ncbi:Zinc/iron permease [Eremomyces bilateralis CBS 781.70]|uniref:Zinc/iron permease n=1 Tax=Eremomyces bilateralis CBS 781.70 TaxID=1392243 RepID=A0A6G1G7D3_9PEZI|nr:Zinc/iron permease [Eremomyces bilateralis CBS 781.70]KAF1813749.1 Zinc/iron permease [Eremomyces bilateralis CBS 781.70]
MDDVSPRNSKPEWTTIPTTLLQAELSRRQDAFPPKPTCGSGVETANYDTGIHIAALVLVLILSTLACAFPIVCRRFPRVPVPHQFLFLSRHFGTGVLVATAFVHLLPTAFISLTDPCLPRFWNQQYPEMAGLIAMVAVMVVVGIEMWFAMKGAGHKHAHGELGFEFDVLPNGPSDEEEAEALNPSARSLVDASASASHPLSSPCESLQSDRTSGHSLNESDPLSPTNSTPTHTEPNSRTSHLQVLLLEAGILFHSIFIGLSLSLTSGAPFAVLLLAIAFHQTFEGLALGSRIASLDFSPVSTKLHYIPGILNLGKITPYFMCLAFGMTVPLGQFFGLLLVAFAQRGKGGEDAAAFDPKSEAGLLLLGISNAISSGLLLFSGLVTLVAEDFLSAESYQALKGRRRAMALAMVVFGAVAMSVVGAWA